MGTFEQIAILVGVLIFIALHVSLAWFIRARAMSTTASGPDNSVGAARRWATLIFSWVFLCGPLGAAVYLITSFAFAFSSTQGGMVPLISAAFWIVELSALTIGTYSLARLQSLRMAVPRMLLTAAIGWCVAFGVEWLLAGRR